MKKITSIALIPARSGSKRILNKNIKVLNGHPLMAYTIEAALKSNIFDSVVCCTDDPHYAEIANYYGAETPYLRSKKISGDQSPDIEWVSWILNKLLSQKIEFDTFSILRPTSPFRRSQTIQRAWELFTNSNADSIRAVEKCSQHPGKMWVIRNNNMLPIIPLSLNDTPWHSSQYTSLPEVYVQNASLEISLVRNVFEKHSISGETIAPYICNDIEGFDINTFDDWILAEYYAKNKSQDLPVITKKPFKIK